MIGRRGFFLPTAMLLGYGFLYVPILSVIVYSFNESKLVTVWAGFSARWYGELLGNDQLLSAAWLSVRIAAVSATGATILGTLAGFCMARFKRFTGRTLFSAMVAAPLVMPEIIMGISMLLLFVGLEQTVGWPMGRGVMTVIIAHITFSMAFVSVIVQSRLSGMDRSVEEAAMDLGAKPPVVFALITLPLISPALLAGWLLAFSLSVDDVVITSFVTGPGATTLPLKIFLFGEAWRGPADQCPWPR